MLCIASLRVGLATVAALGLVLVGCGPDSPSAAEEANSGAAPTEQEIARRDVERMVRDVEVETLTKRVTALEIEIEQLKAQQAGASTLELDRRLTQLEAGPAATTKPAIAAAEPSATAAKATAKPSARAKPSPAAKPAPAPAKQPQPSAKQSAPPTKRSNQDVPTGSTARDAPVVRPDGGG